MIKKILIVTISFAFFVNVFLYPRLSFANEKVLENNYMKKSELSLVELQSKRKQLLEENLHLADFSDERRDELRKLAFDSDIGLVKYIDKKFPNLSETKKLEMQNNVLEYLNRNNYTIGDDPLFIETILKEAELSMYLISHKSDGDLTKKENIIKLLEKEDEVFKNLPFDNKEEITLYIIDIIDANFTTEDKMNLIIRNNVSDDIKHELIKDFDGVEKIELLSRTTLKTTPSQYRSKALAYAKKHGYTNGYYGAGTWSEFYTKNNAPSPYINYNSYPNAYDCANFVSQCLYEGGAQFKTGSNPWYFYSDSNRTASWTGANEFKKHWSARVSYGDIVVKDTLSFLRETTPISIISPSGVASHTLISTTKHSNGYNFSFAAHSDKHKRANLLDKLKNKRIFYYKVFW